MNPQTRTRTLAIAAVALVVAVALAYWGYSAYQKKRDANQAVVALVTDSGVRLRDALGIETAPTTTDRTRFLKKLDEHAATADHNLQTAKRASAAADLALGDAADDYLLTVREILKRHAESYRYRVLLAESAQALQGHMRADNRTSAWVQEAVKARERVSNDFRGYRVAASTLDKLLDTYAASQTKIAPYVEPRLLIPATLVDEARKRVQDDLRQATAEIEKTRQTEAFR